MWRPSNAAWDAMQVAQRMRPPWRRTCSRWARAWGSTATAHRAPRGVAARCRARGAVAATVETDVTALLNDLTVVKAGLGKYAVAATNAITVEMEIAALKAGTGGGGTGGTTYARAVAR